MREAVIVASSRTPLAKSFRGSFNLTRPDDLAAHCIKDVLGKVPQVDAKEVEDVIMGCGQPHGIAGPQHRARRGDARRPAGLGRRAHAQPLLLLGPAGDRDRRESRHQRRRRRHDRRRRRVDHDGQARQRSQSVGEGACARHLHGDGRHGRGRRQALQDQPRGPGPDTRSRASSAPRALSRKVSSRRSWRR